MPLDSENNMPPFDLSEQTMLKAAADDPKGVKLKGREQKTTARMLSLRGLGKLNKSVTRLTVRPAGQFALRFAQQAAR